ncbi:thermonuclease family protein [Mesorhizobium sp. ZC-5]|jgi:micrococcal nuclease|uniref:thermonuclease family protein n=1 Tax=Mesorhizobium sp. ZC-5 TaxID=2986066 RepID=UPI0021E90587|nr:thermonuclease family protein [Mesorhizobium sp. ZC-5]MCV3238990.1 thermonuclease family protein [Mesorhizobium sp. ZC-5]
MSSNASRARLRLAAILAVAVSVLFAGSGEAKRRGNFEGPVEATVLNVLDGDTFMAEAHVWPGQVIEVNIRVRGIDAPEMKSRCEAEHAAALKARRALADLIGTNVRISNIGSAKYYGRVLADVETQAGEFVADQMLEQALVRPYKGGRRAGWCD